MFLRKAQSGSLYIVVIFVLVVMGFLATSLSRIEWSNSDAHSKDVMGLQASLLAYSANELVLRDIYPPRAALTDSFDVAAACLAANGTTRAVTASVSCQDVAIECEPRGGVLADGAQLYVLTSIAICGTGLNQMQRSQEVWLRDTP
ncbi:MSHA biogenesis protein MshP [Vibrio sinaloensis DSM 21326]|uniref:MSHA biogenesis protein MshP n=1 Tax=Vibrio sinaloensis DSM 21326 TaxID=945550 RepID=E8M2H1_PHOS4|nr:hypothetical protein [Vibrio sinaloensis]EGA71798.1 MSHA biogenesis protein MshP [Vibrio sinaloensis DSM 21326]